MRIAKFALCLCLLLFAARVASVLTTSIRFIRVKAIQTLEFHIPAPEFSLDQIIRAASIKHGVKPGLIKSIIAAESAFSSDAVSAKGAVGLMQLMPETARQLSADPLVPEQNVEAGAHYLSWLLQRYARKRNKLQRAIAAYNAGPGAVERFHGVPPYRETRAYVARVLRFYRRYQNDPFPG